MYPITAGLIVETKELWEELQKTLEGLPIRLAFELAEIPTDWSAFIDRLNHVRPDVVLMEITKLSLPLEEAVKRIRSTSGEPAVFALHQDAQPQSILGALRAGVSEFLYPPFGESLVQAFERLGEARQASRDKLMRGGKVAGFLSAKGGCGATTIACHTAVELAKQSGGKVLLADWDTQAGLVSFLLKTKSTYSIADAVANLQRLDQSYWRGLISNGIPNLEIITAPSTPAAKQLPPAHLKQVLSFARTQYDWTVLDLGRNVNTTVLAMLDLIDQTYLVTIPEVPALHQTKSIIQLLLDAGYARSNLRVILNRSTRRLDVTVEELESMLGLPVFCTILNDYEALNEAYSEGRLVQSETDLGEDYARLAAKVAGLPDTPKKKKFSLFG